MPGGREGGHVHADLADQVLGRPHTEAGDPSSWAICRSYGSQDGDPLVQHCDLGGELVDVAQHHLQDEGVAGGEERAVRASRSWAIFRRIRVRAFCTGLRGRARRR